MESFAVTHAGFTSRLKTNAKGLQKPFTLTDVTKRMDFSASGIHYITYEWRRDQH